MSGRTHRAFAMRGALALAIGPTGWGADDTPIADGGATTAGATTTTASETPYFAGDDHVGERVTITAAVDTGLTEGSVVLDADYYADEYGLAEAVLFDTHADEEFLTAASVGVEESTPPSG